MLGKIFCSEDLYNYEQYASKVEIEVQPGIWEDRNALFAALQGKDVLLVRNQTIVNEELFENVPNLKGVGRLGVGMDNVDIEAARARGVQVFNGADCNTIAVAEYCLAQTLNIIRKLPSAMKSTRKGEWNRPAFRGLELSEVQIGIVGFGQIGKAFAERLEKLGCRVLVYSKNPQKCTATFDELLSKSDIISLHLPATEETFHMFGKNEFRKMKSNAWILNTARGAVVNEEELIVGLLNHKPAGAILDVREVEPSVVGKLETLENVYLTPHIACLTRLAQEKLSKALIEDAIRVINGECPIFTCL